MIQLTEQQRQLAEQLLISVVNRESYIEYNELANRITPPMFWRQVGREIGKISELCNELGLPLISAKVVSKGQLRAGDGFFELMKLLGRYDHLIPEREQFRNELNAIRECTEWYKLADYLGIEIDLPRPDPVHGERQEGATTWIFPCDVSKYDVFSAFIEFDTIDWRQSVKCTPGDIVYIYCGRPFQRIVHRAVVAAANILPEEANMSDDKYWSGGENARGTSRFGYARLCNLETHYGNGVALDYLLENGLIKSAPQGPMKAQPELGSYLDELFRSSSVGSYYEDEDHTDIAPQLREGTLKQVTVNAYERNPVDRRKCIAIHGAKCAICGFDFGKTYGSDFEGLIHVHHLTPLHTLGAEYVINPETDLIPVCPNCHLALHAKKDGVYTPAELRSFLE